jgi:hypothetical protein
MYGVVDPTAKAPRYAGYTDGTTGRPPEKRLLAQPPADAPT